MLCDKRFTGAILCKISKITHLKELQKGSIYMNRLDYYTKRENKKNGDGFLDQEEGLILKNFKIICERNNQKKIFENLSARKGMATPVFCCSQINIPNIRDGECKEFFLDSRLIDDFSNGDENEYGVLLISKEDFLRRIKDTSEQHGLIYYMGKVYYKEFENSIENINKFPKILFRKSPKYSYQNEFRIILRRSIYKAFTLEIGDISDISYLVNLKILNNPFFAMYDEKSDLLKIKNSFLY